MIQTIPRMTGDLSNVVVVGRHAGVLDVRISIESNHTTFGGFPETFP